MEKNTNQSEPIAPRRQEVKDPALSSFFAKKELEAKLLGTMENLPEDPIEDEDSITPAQLAMLPPAPKRMQAPDNNYTNDDGSITVKIKPKKTSIEVTFKATEPKGTFSIKLPTVDVTVTDDSVTAIILPEVEIVPPTLVPLTVKVNSVSYEVIYAGATCALNKLRFMSFVRIQEN